ncbi:MAG TPA: glycosyl hydrolase, partial [Actinomycetospora sp.]|nr:glycosyl hydrolase [Actinomycetospora sp.]
MALTTSDRARIDDLLARMPLEHKIAQLVGAWIGIDSTTGAVAPAQNENMPTSPDWATLASTGLGHITRLFGTRPLDPDEGRAALRRM